MLLNVDTSQVSFDSRQMSTVLLFLVLELLFQGAKSASRADVETHLENGRNMLARGQLAEALNAYHAAVEGDPSNYLTYFKRGTVYLALGKAKFAIGDFSKALEINPSFTAARMQKASVHLKLAEYNEAEQDFLLLLHEDPYNEEVNYLFNRIEPAREQWQLIRDLQAAGRHRDTVEMLTQMLEISPWSPDLRESRAAAYLKLNDHLAAVSDLRSVNKLTQDSTDGFLKLAELLYDIGHAVDSLKEIRECLKLDPEHKDCFPFYKKVKKVEKQLSDAQTHLNEGRFAQCVEAANKALKLEKDVLMIVFSAKQLLCKCHLKDERFTDAVRVCKEATDIFQDPQVICDRAEALMGAEMYDDAVHEYQEALRLDEHLSRAKEGIDKAKRLQKQAEKRDYYKILGVKRNASKQDIIKAYRKAAQEWHPDKFQGDEKKIAEKKFIDIAAAKEVLTNPEKRRQFDQGEDPLDPESSQNPFGGFRGGGSQFHHFQHGSPFQFKFHFS